MTRPADSEPLLRVDDLKTYFSSAGVLPWQRTEPVRAVDGVSFEVFPGETLGLVGESGSGKSTVGRTILRLIPATSGRVSFGGVDVLAAGPGAMRKLRRDMQMVFQDPAGSLNPRMRIADIVAEPMEVHGIGGGRADRFKRAEALLERCGMPKAAANRYPHEFSGGQRQRIGIARALALDPKFIVCDEPTSALDVSVQAQIINLLQDLQRDLGLSYLFISHDMAVIRHMCQRIAVMRAGKIVELASAEQIIERPEEAYTKALIEAVPDAVTPGV